METKMLYFLIADGYCTGDEELQVYLLFHPIQVITHGPTSVREILWVLWPCCFFDEAQQQQISYLTNSSHKNPSPYIEYNCVRIPAPPHNTAI